MSNMQPIEPFSRADQAAGLSEHGVRAAKCPRGLPRITLRDTGKWTGLELRITAKGVKTFSCVVRQGAARRRATLGTWGDEGAPDTITLAEARRRFRQAVGQPPEDAPEESKPAGPTVGELFADWHASRASDGRPWTRNAKRIYELHIVPTAIDGVPVVSMAVKDLRRTHVYEVLDKARERASQWKRNGRRVTGHGIRNQVLAIFSRILNYAIDRDRYGIEYNVAAKMERAPQTKRDQYIKVDRLGEVWHAVAALENVDQREALQCVILSAQRGRQIRLLDWSWINWDEQCIEFPARAMKAKRAHVLGLPPLLLSVLQARHERAGRPARGLAFGDALETRAVRRKRGRPFAPKRMATARKEARPMDYQTVRRAYAKLTKALKIEDATLHDWRRAFSNATKAKRVSREDRSRVLAHVDPSMTERHYTDEGYPEETRDALAMWETIILTAAAGDKVVPLRQPRAADAG